MKKKKTTAKVEFSPYINSVHRWGRISSVLTILLLISVPLAICVHFNVWPAANDVFNGLLKVIPIFWTSAVLEVITYSPMLGTGATYLSFVTGNITNLKLPCVLNAKESAKVKSDSEEAEVISTIATATSSIVTTVIIAVGVVALSPFLKYLTDENSVVKPAFDYVLPALFGALGAGYFIKHWKISIFPIVLAVVILIFAPTIGTGTLVPICVIGSILAAFVMFKLGWLDSKEERKAKKAKK
ncbi:MAG: hypothetical protein PUB20_08410 [Clostridia bacterium]|nr:hypothetical protein [Clostridia bacterium]